MHVCVMLGLTGTPLQEKYNKKYQKKKVTKVVTFHVCGGAVMGALLTNRFQ
jgi:hypothetical protein